ncbi:MAG: phage tail protein [Cyanobacteria bacterium P01_H01_bin.21]
MAEFALICEGITDQVIITDILCGFFSNEDLDEDISRLQPPFDATTQKQKDFGGWQMLLAYLESSQFRDAVLSNRYVVVHVDSDISSRQGFDVKHTDEQNEELSVEMLVDKVISKLIEVVNTKAADFYQNYREKIIFCISVHSIECWLLAHYRSKPPKNPKIKGCENELKRVLGRKYGQRCAKDFTKNYRYYRQLSEPFLENKSLQFLASQEPSFKVFWNCLEFTFGTKPDLKTFLMKSDPTLEGLDLRRDGSFGREIDL